MADLSTVDPVAVAVQHLKAHTAVLTALGGADHVSGLIEAPWPHLRVTDGEGGDLRELRRSAEFEVLLEMYGAPLNQTSEAEVRRLATVAMLALKDLETDPPLPGKPVCSSVEASGVLVNQQLANGQYRYTAGMSLVLRPADDPT